MLTAWEKNLMAAINKMPYPGGLIELRYNGDEVVALYWGWLEGDKKYKGWFDTNGNPINMHENKEQES